LFAEDLSLARGTEMLALLNKLEQERPAKVESVESEDDIPAAEE
jgi:hypothetical protein